MRPPSDDTLRASRFRDLYETTHADVVRFVRRRAGPDVADDVAHEAFLVAWRRLDDIPVEHGAARAWLFTTARNCILSDRRGAARRDALPIRLAAERDDTEAVDGEVSLRLDLQAAWPRLLPDQQLGISPAAYRIRLHRARGALRRLLDTPASSAIFRTTTATES
jgi:DNA-directed RNA polymerase specialized sigma24 family protein